ncbi:phage holin [Lysinibacillus xylanilyticus]
MYTALAIAVVLDPTMLGTNDSKQAIKYEKTKGDVK